MLGLLWLSTVPPTSGLVALMFGTRWLAMLFGFAFFSHQVGGFLGVWLGGLLFERTGSYDAVWWLSILLGVLVGGDQSADRREAGCAPAGRAGLKRTTADTRGRCSKKTNPRPRASVRCPPLDWRSDSWRTPAVVLICGCLICHDRLRAALGARLLPHADVHDHGWGREMFALSVAMQTLLYGAAQPFSGAIADRFGTVRVIIAGDAALRRRHLHDGARHDAGNAVSSRPAC